MSDMVTLEGASGGPGDTRDSLSYEPRFAEVDVSYMDILRLERDEVDEGRRTLFYPGYQKGHYADAA